MNYRYQSSNPVDGSYGVRFNDTRKAFDHAQQTSACFVRECWIVDTDTGEVLAQYDHGMMVYMAA